MMVLMLIYEWPLLAAVVEVRRVAETAGGASLDDAVVESHSLQRGRYCF